MIEENLEQEIFHLKCKMREVKVVTELFQMVGLELE